MRKFGPNLFLKLFLNDHLNDINGSALRNDLLLFEKKTSFLKKGIRVDQEFKLNLDNK